MPIDNDNPVVVPAISAVPEKTFPHVWLTSINVEAPTQTAGSIRIEHVPYNGDTYEIQENSPVSTIDTANLWTAVQEVSAVAVAMQCIFDAVEPLREWIAARALSGLED